jgi:pimeloyl-ACP methyl ester carboxylesterase
MAIAYSIYGKGPSVVLLHGFGEDGSIWENQIQFLASHFQLIVPDLIGSGKSELHTNSDISIESMADDVRSILAKENLNSCFILGHSMGGYIALAFAEKFPEMLKGLGLIHSTSFADTAEKKIARQKGIDFIREHGNEAFMNATIPNLYGAKFKEEFPEIFQRLLKKSYEIKAETLVNYYVAMMKRKDRTDLLKNSPVPIFIFIGDDDKAVSPEDALYQSALPPRCHVKLVAGIAHSGMWEAPEILNQEILKYLNLSVN